MPALELERLDHVGVVVDDLRDAVRLLGEALGLEPGPVIDREDLRAAFFSCGNASIEVIEPRGAEARRRRLGDAGARIEHIAIEVSDLSATLRGLAALGIEATAPPRRSGDAVTFWTKPETSDGVMFQFLQRGG